MSEQDAPRGNRDRRNIHGHPENDLTSDFDFSNRPFPQAQSPEELSAGPDPAWVAAENRKSTFQALWYVIGLLVSLAVLGFLLALAARLAGGPICEGGDAVWICSEFARIWWPIVTTIFAFLGIVGCAVIMVRKLNARLRWWPWMAAFWFLLPLMMLWATTTLPIVIMQDGPIF